LRRVCAAPDRGGLPWWVVLGGATDEIVTRPSQHDSRYATG